MTTRRTFIAGSLAVAAVASLPAYAASRTVRIKTKDWIDGHLHRVTAGDAVAFPAGTGICHTFINNGSAEARMITIGQRDVPGNRLFYPLNPEMRTKHPRFWDDAPKRPLGPHDGRANR